MLSLSSAPAALPGWMDAMLLRINAALLARVVACLAHAAERGWISDTAPQPIGYWPIAIYCPWGDWHFGGGLGDIGLLAGNRAKMDCEVGPCWPIYGRCES